MNFINDEEKMRDFKELSKEEFLNMYSYLSEEDYKETVIELAKNELYELKESDLEDIEISTMGLILQNKNDSKDIYVLVSDSNYDRDYFINVFYPDRTEITPEWDFSYMDYLFDPLAKGYEIVWINEDVHPVLWEDISNGYDEEYVKDDKGIQAYLKYCKDNDITFEKVVDNYLNYGDILELYVEDSNETYTTLDFLEECKTMALHNIFCYSDGKFISKPKEGYEKEFYRESKKLEIIEKLINEEINKVKNKDSYER